MGPAVVRPRTAPAGDSGSFLDGLFGTGRPGGPTGRYARGSIGFGFLSDADNESVLIDLEGGYDPGLDMSVALGMRWLNRFRTEAEIA